MQQYYIELTTGYTIEANSPEEAEDLLGDLLHNGKQNTTRSDKDCAKLLLTESFEYEIKEQ
jgi:hypothetical protein